MPTTIGEGRSRKVALKRRPGLALVEHLDGAGPLIFHHACKMKLEGIVSKRKNLGYRSGPSKGAMSADRGEAADHVATR
jgi:ATP-dependent DNA ligase